MPLPLLPVVGGAFATGSFWRLLPFVFVGSIRKLLGALGVGIFVFTGVELAINQAKDYILQNLHNSAYGTVSDILEICQVETGLSIIFAAMAFKAACGGVRKKFGIVC